MTPGSRLFAAALAVALAAPTAAHKAESLKLARTDRDGAVLLDSPRLANSYHLYLTRIAPDGTLTGFWQIYVSASFRITPTGIVPSGERKLSALRLKPGRYTVTHAVQNLNWRACLWAGTLAFDVKPGVATYIGEVDPRPPLDDLVAQAEAEGLTKVLSANIVHRFKDGVAPLGIADPDQARLVELDGGRAGLFKDVTAPIEARSASAFRLPSRDAARQFCNQGL